METPKDTEEKKTTVKEEKEGQQKADRQTSNEGAASKKTQSIQREMMRTHLRAKDTENPKKEDKLVYIAEFKDKESGEKVLRNYPIWRTKFYIPIILFNGAAIETNPR